MSSSSNIAIVILAAGASTRMGSPKQLLNWGETSLINHIITNSKAIKSSHLAVVLGANFEIIASEIVDPSVSIINNKEWQKGLGKSIAYASQFAMDSKEVFDGILLILADQPFVSSSYLGTMIDTFNSEMESIVTTSYGNQKIGVPALFSNSFFEELSQLSGDEGAKSILEKYRDFVKVLTPDFQNLDMDTKADYKSLKKLKKS